MVWKIFTYTRIRNGITWRKSTVYGIYAKYCQPNPSSIDSPDIEHPYVFPIPELWSNNPSLPSPRLCGSISRNRLYRCLCVLTQSESFFLKTDLSFDRFTGSFEVCLSLVYTVRRISLYATDGAIAKLYVMESLVKWREMVEYLVT